MRKVTSNEDRSPRAQWPPLLLFIVALRNALAQVTNRWSPINGGLPVVIDYQCVTYQWALPSYPVLVLSEKLSYECRAERSSAPQWEAISRSVCRTSVNIIYFILLHPHFLPLDSKAWSLRWDSLANPLRLLSLFLFSYSSLRFCFLFSLTLWFLSICACSATSRTSEFSL